MKKLITAITVLAMALTILVGCGGNESSCTAELGFERMPETMNSFAYINVKNAREVNAIKSLLDAEDDEAKELSKMINEIYLGTNETKFKAIHKMPKDTDSKDNIKEAYEDQDFVVLVSGQFEKEKIMNIVKETEDNPIEGTFAEIDAVTIDEGKLTVLFVSNSVLIFTNKGFEETALDAFLNGKNTVDTNSTTFKEINAMNQNILQTVLDLTEMGEIDLVEKTSGMLEGKTSFGITTIGLSRQDDNIVFEISSEVDSDEMAQTIAQSANNTIGMVKMLASGQVSTMEISEDAKKDINDAISQLEVNTQNNILLLSVRIKESTMDEIAGMTQKTKSNP